jgi:hypothetical protein
MTKKQVSLTINSAIIEEVDQIAQGLRVSRSRAVEDLLQLAFGVGAAVDKEKLTYTQLEDIRDLEGRVQELEEMVGVLTRERKVSK